MGEQTIAHCMDVLWERQTNARINHIHERVLTAVYNKETTPFEELLGKDRYARNYLSEKH